MFSRSPQGGHVPELTPEIVALFKQNMELTGQRECYIHVPYFINFASANPRIKHGSIAVVRQELERGTQLGAKYVMAHLGSYKDLGKEKGFLQVVEGLAEALAPSKRRGVLTYAHTDAKSTQQKGVYQYAPTNKSTQFLIEISAGAGEVIGDTFKEIAEILDNKRLEDYKIGVCFDTQHAFGSGYDLRTPEAVAKTLDTFDKLVGLDKLKMFHCNDSKVEFNSHKDRHEHIGEGHIGRAGFEALLGDPRLKNKNFILETEHDKVREDLKMLKQIRETVL